jgi:MscS family membrane protein
MFTFSRLLPILILCLALRPAIAEAQTAAFDIKAADTSSPRDTLRSFIDACNELDALIKSRKYFDRRDPQFISVVERVLDCIDDSEIPAFSRYVRAGEVAICLKEILDRVALPDWEEIPDTAELLAASDTESVTHYRIPETRITIAKVETGPRRHEHLFSPGTVDRAVDYYHSVMAEAYRTNGPAVSEGFYDWYVSAPGNPWLGSLVEQLPDRLRFGQTLGLANWKWSGLAALVLIALVLLWLNYQTYFRLSLQADETKLLRYWLLLVFPIAGVLIPISVEYLAYRSLTLRSAPLYVTDFVATLAALLAALFVIFATSNRIAASLIAMPNVSPLGLNAQLIRIVAKLASLVAAVILFLVGGQYLGIPIATLLASAGIGGIAVALGAQDSLKTLFGTINLLADKPFSVGERIVCKTFDGVVEDIGLRSTRLRLLNGHQVTIPNDQLAGNDIENVGRRNFLRRKDSILIPLDTSFKQVERAVEIVRQELENHEGMDAQKPPRVFLDQFSANAFSIVFYYWYAVPDFWAFKAFGDKLNFNILRRFQEAGIQFSLPLRHSFWKHDDQQGPLDVHVKRDDGQA